MIERFAVPDELTCYYDRPAEPANVHLEAHIPGRLDEAAVRASVRAVLTSEPGLRARRARTGRWRRSYYWEFPQDPDGDPVGTATHADEAELDRQRDVFLSQSPSLDTSPPLLFLLTSGPGGDCLILNAHHARFDGLSCLRLLRKVAQEYGARAAEARPGASGPPESERPRLLEQRAAAPASGIRPTARTRARTIARIAPGQGRPRSLPGYGAYLLTWDGLAVADSLRSAGASVNDLLITALMITISDWNDSRVGHRGQIRITMPVGDRAQAGRDGQWANRSRLTAVAARVPAGTLGPELLDEVAQQTRYAKEHPGPQTDLFSRALAAAPVPVAVKHGLLRTALRVAGPLLCDTSLVSNLGVIEAPAFGASTASQVWFSTSAHMPRGLSLGSVTACGRLRLTFRYRHALFSDADAAEFAGRYAKVLDQFTPDGVATC